MILSRAKKLLSYIKSGQWDQAKQSVRLFILHIFPFLARFRRRRNINLSKILFKVFGYRPPDNELTRKIKVDIIVQDGHLLPKSSAFIRLVAPLTHSAIADKISLKICENISELRDNTKIIIIQRTVIESVAEAKNLIKLARDNKAKLIVDTDDAFFNLDKKHPNYHELHDRHDALLHLIKNADQLWVSTDNLKKYYQKICQTPAYTIPNTLDSRVWKKNNIKQLSDKLPLKLLYMGTATHQEDFEMIVPWLDNLYKKYPGSFKLRIIGVSDELPEKPWLELLDRDKKTVVYTNFAKWIQSEGPFDIGLAPLVNSTFNQYKSDIKCLDYLAIGTVPMVSAIDSYDNKDLGGFILKNGNVKEGWLKPLEEIILNPGKFRQKRLEMLKKGQAYIWEKRSSEITAKQIIKLLEIN